MLHRQPVQRNCRTWLFWICNSVESSCSHRQYFPFSVITCYLASLVDKNVQARTGVWYVVRSRLSLALPVLSLKRIVFTNGRMVKVVKEDITL